MKKVTYRDYCKATDALWARFGPDVEIYDMGATLDRPEIQMGVNWAAKGTVPAGAALAFARKLIEAADAAEHFKYNGYQIEY